MTPEEAYKYFLPYIQDRCVACNAWPLTLCDSETVWIHSRRLAALNKKIPSEVMYKARSKPRPVEREPEDDMEIYFYGARNLGDPFEVHQFTGDRNLIAAFAEFFYTTIYFYARPEDVNLAAKTIPIMRSSYSHSKP